MTEVKDKLVALEYTQLLRNACYVKFRYVLVNLFVSITLFFCPLQETN